MRLGFLASERQYADHLRPLWDFSGPFLRTWHRSLRSEADVWIVAATRDLRQVPDAVYMDHGCGLQWHAARNIALLKSARGVLAPNEFLAERYRRVGIDAAVVGTPKMDALVGAPYHPGGPVAVSFHWTGSQRAQKLYQGALLDLPYPLLGHGHPRAKLAKYWANMGVEYVEDFRQVVERASVYACDHSSTIYEWAALGRPVVLLDVPQQQHIRPMSSGLRYRIHADVGCTATPATLRDVLAAPRPPTDVSELFPFLGSSVARVRTVLGERYG